MRFVAILFSVENGCLEGEETEQKRDMGQNSNVIMRRSVGGRERR
jgi:hypothetical protein